MWSSRWVFLTAAWALLVGTALGLRPILPVDETRYVSVAWEMWLRGDFLVPHLNGAPYSQKPPLLFWLFHLGWRLFGVNEWWPRLVPALFALANLGLTARLARRLWPDRREIARAAPAVLLGFLLWSVYTTLMMFDMLVAFCVLLALLGLEEAWRRGGVRPWLQVGGALGLGILAKGPVVLLIPLFVILLARWWGRDGERSAPRAARWGPRLLGGLGAACLTTAIALAWVLPAAAAGGTEYANAILVSQTEERVVHSHAHNRPGWWYLALLPALLYPYSAWPPLWKALARVRSLDPGARFCLAWLVPGLIAFSMISSKQPHYLLPLMPAFALLAAWLLTAPGVTVRRWHVGFALAGLFVVGGLVAAAPLLHGRPGLPTWVAAVSPGAGAALLVLGAALFLAGGRLFVRQAAGPTLIALSLVLGAHLAFSKAARHAYGLEPVARHLSAVEGEGRPIAWVGDYHGQLHFLGRLRRPFEEIARGSESLWIRSHPRGKVIQELRYIPPDAGRPDFTQPYRDDVLAVWSLEGAAGP